MIWSTSFLLIKISLDSIPPFTLTSIRLGVAALVLCAVVLLRGEKIPLHRSAIRLYIVVGVLGNALPFALISWGEVYIDSSLAAILMGIMPISTFVLAHFFIPSESMTQRKVLGVVFGFVGLITLVGLSALGAIGSHVFGQLVVLGGALSYSVTTIYVRSQPAFKGTHMATGAAVVAVLTCLPMAFILESPGSITPTAEAVTASLVLGLLNTAVAALIYFRVIHNLGAVTFAQINYLIPVLGSIWGILLLGEFIGWRVVLALGLVLIGVYFVQPTRNR